MRTVKISFADPFETPLIECGCGQSYILVAISEPNPDDPVDQPGWTMPQEHVDFCPYCERKSLSTSK